MNAGARRERNVQQGPFCIPGEEAQSSSGRGASPAPPLAASRSPVPRRGLGSLLRGLAVGPPSFPWRFLTPPPDFLTLLNSFSRPPVFSRRQKQRRNEDQRLEGLPTAGGPLPRGLLPAGVRAEGEAGLLGRRKRRGAHALRGRRHFDGGPPGRGGGAGEEAQGEGRRRQQQRPPPPPPPARGTPFAPRPWATRRASAGPESVRGARRPARRAPGRLRRPRSPLPTRSWWAAATTPPSSAPPTPSHNDFVAILDLPEGEHQYKFFVDGQWVHDPSETFLAPLLEYMAKKCMFIDLRSVSSPRPFFLPISSKSSLTRILTFRVTQPSCRSQTM
uniref:5'-AMP-activated protein kinase subunit beta-2 isoform X2 n=1 Tax=Podarcis muralis TaxID=64176 RepID=UPI0010A0999E|nr:5'-AMP-activated protein kinase subunit beta-2 isoform X2 [Podarcis muralis]XP_028588005.1 5'-AMP-activated protein kinase subunit beta-2 isoform X2 [Podarcis muralis]XP_028588006.1 5'-AMP-activated protein kinase subunit beta-2 isoform X2 [Podarcis muralis]XP_028588007.1 5'-AMP-activated protein kinase subunit beta-2 isoform X2 [Podarcis muralis]